MLSNERINRVLTLLTILSTLTIPTSLISTIYGMNVKLPGRIESPWTFFGPYTTLMVVGMIAISTALIILWFLYRSGWIVRSVSE
jgi:magnesium transporter